jgi:GTPase
MESTNVISLFDLPGLTKFLQTTYYGISSIKPHYNIITICPKDYYDKKKISDDTISFLKISIKHNIPFIIIFTKIDLIDINIDFTDIINNIEKCIKQFDINLNLVHIDNYSSQNNVPYVKLTNMKNNYDEYYKIFKNIITLKKNIINSTSTRFNIIEVYNIPDKGTVVSGLCLSGILECGKLYYIGPNINNNDIFVPIIIETVHKKQISCKKINTDESGSVEICFLNKSVNFHISKNMEIISHDIISNYEYTNLIIKIDEKLKDTNIKIGFQYIIYFNNFVETVIIHSIEDNDIIIKCNQKYICNGTYNCLLKGDYKPDIVVCGKLVVS